MKSIVSALALSLALSTSALAASHMQAFTEYTYTENDLRASELIGMRVYATENEVNDGDAIAEGGEQEWDDIGEIDDVILSRDGSVKAVILGVGGFLGIGEKDIAVEMDRIRFVQEEGEDDDFFLVVNANKEMLESAPAHVRDGDEEAMKAVSDTEGSDQGQADEQAATEEGEQSEEQAAAESTDGEQTAAADTDASEGMQREMLMRPEVEREGYQTAVFEELTTERLTGARVYGTNDEDIGEIHELIVDTGGQITKAVIDVGGFLGIGEHRIAVTFDELQVIRDETWGDVRVYIDATEEALEKQPAYEG